MVWNALWNKCIDILREDIMYPIFEKILKSKFTMYIHFYILLPRAFFYVRNESLVYSEFMTICIWVLLFYLIITNGLYLILRIYLMIKSSINKRILRFTIDTTIAICGVALSVFLQKEEPTTACYACGLTVIPVIVNNYALLRSDWTKKSDGGRSIPLKKIRETGDGSKPLKK